MAVSDWLSFTFTLLGTFFFFAGTVGLLRFPDVYTRLHALTKADGLGLGLTVMGLILQVGAWEVALKLVMIWILVMFSSATACHLVARAALRAALVLGFAVFLAVAAGVMMAAAACSNIRVIGRQA